MKLELLSERFTALGAIDAAGIGKLMGAPGLDRLSVVIREAVQNSWDARLSDTIPLRILIRLRNLTDPQRTALRRLISEVPNDNRIGPALTNVLQSAELPQLLEVSDFGTTGLAGPTDADEVLQQGESANFIDFIRNVGKTHESLGGGTYGFGKASNYALSQVGTIFVDSVTDFRGRKERRAIVAAMGRQFTDGGVKFTGRHWWGRRHGDARLSPVLDADADCFAEFLSLPSRARSDTGTTIGILAPDIDRELSHSELAAGLLQVIMLNFWPKMIPAVEGGPPSIRFEVELNGTAIPVPSPWDTAPFNYFATALQRARSGHLNAPQSAEIRTRGKQVHLGYAGFASGPRLPRDGSMQREARDEITQHPLFDDGASHHYAVMRPSELVVRYFEGAGLPSQHDEWAGVFITSDVPDVERAFANSEPPAHDNWDPSSLQGEEHRYVYVALRELTATFRNFVHPVRAPQSGDTQLGPAAIAIGRLLPGLTQPASKSRKKRGKAEPPQVKGAAGRFADVLFEDYVMLGGEVHLSFTVTWRPPAGVSTLSAFMVTPEVVIDGSLKSVDELPADWGKPVVRSVLDDAGHVVPTNADGHYMFDPHISHRFRIIVSRPESKAITGIRLSAQDSDAA